MAETYKDFAREPSKPHQCMHTAENDGARCRAIAMHNEYMCYHHRSDDIPNVIQNDPFLIASLHDHDAIQQALTDVAARLACNHMDFKRAALLLQSLQIATSNLASKQRMIANMPETPLPRRPFPSPEITSSNNKVESAPETSTPVTPTVSTPATPAAIADVSTSIAKEVPVISPQATPTSDTVGVTYSVPKAHESVILIEQPINPNPNAPPM